MKTTEEEEICVKGMARCLRSGFEGKTGILFKQMVKIWRWVKKHNPDCAYFIENVVFDGMQEWEYIYDAFGEPAVVNSKYRSFTARTRAYWTSFRERLQFI